MPDSVSLSYPTYQLPSNSIISSVLRPVLASAAIPDPVELAASFGRWWHDAKSGQLVLSRVAADMLCVSPGWHASVETCFAHVVPDDIFMLVAALEEASLSSEQIEYEFCLLNERSGLRWQRLTSLPPVSDRPGLATGLLLDTTTAKHAAIRERLSFESTRFLVGTDTFGEAVTKVIQLVCENLGWDWGAYWAVKTDAAHATQGRQLVCQHSWHRPQDSIGSFATESGAIGMAPGEGLVGLVWQTGQARWIEDMAHDLVFLRQKGARKSRLQSGYVFPVVYVTDDGVRHSPGVLEFYSRLARQSEAQLPNLSVAIGALVAQTAQRLEQQETIRHLAQIDGLTELANRSHFHQMLERLCVDAGASGSEFGLMFIDLDRFKPVNDAFGHEAGNAVLRDFALRLRALVPAAGAVGRLGGDEFAILVRPSGALSGIGAQLDALAANVLHAARLPFQFDGHELTISASIGISVFPENGSTAPELLRSADAAMYGVKKKGRNALGFFSNSTSSTLAVQQGALAQKMSMEAALHQALRQKELFLEYQPVFDSSGLHVHAVEALIRWRRASGEVIRPDVFIPIAEQSRLIVHIGRWVVRQACSDLARLHALGFKDLVMHVNMAAPEFTDRGLPDDLSAIADACGIRPSDVCLELTEGLLIQQPDNVIPVMRHLREIGFGISLDDFGMGYSSLSRLRSLPISSMKIDRSFVGGLPHQRDDRAIARTIIELGHRLNLQVIAEGVETDEQLALLRQYGCAFMQGFVLSRPKPVDELIALYGPRSGT